jgi:hypothetical protein
MLRHLAHARPAHRQADAQILLYRELREDLAPLRYVADAQRRALLGP